MIDVKKLNKFMSDDEMIQFLIIYNKVIARKQNLITEQEFNLLKNFLSRFSLQEWKNFKKAVSN